MTRHEFNEIEEAEDLAQSFVNGNKSYVRNEIGDSIKKFDAIMTVLKNSYDKEVVLSFKRFIILGKYGIEE